MFSIDTPTAATTLPAPAAAGTPGYFTGGNPNTGIPPTTISPDWLNAIQQELLAILAAASIAASKTATNQVLTALRALFNVGGSWAGTGYALLPGGLIVQWGAAAQSGSSGSQAVTFPIAFPTAGLRAFATNLAGGPPTAFHGTPTPSTSGMTVYSAPSTGVAAPAGVSFNWLVIGY